MAEQSEELRADLRKIRQARDDRALSWGESLRLISLAVEHHKPATYHLMHRRSDFEAWQELESFEDEGLAIDEAVALSRSDITRCVRITERRGASPEHEIWVI